MEPVMTLFFSGSIRGGTDCRDRYQEIMHLLQRYGRVISEHLPGDEPDDDRGLTGDEAIYARDCAWIRESALLVAEVSQPSIGVGYEIAYAEARGIPVLALYHSGAPRPLSAMIAGNPAICTICYDSLEQLDRLLQQEFPPERDMRETGHDRTGKP
jgi:2'-deoxynucleoside 5'-phosphate N-hydrolase